MRNELVGFFLESIRRSLWWMHIRWVCSGGEACADLCKTIRKGFLGKPGIILLYYL